MSIILGVWTFFGLECPHRFFFLLHDFDWLVKISDIDGIIISLIFPCFLTESSDHTPELKETGRCVKEFQMFRKEPKWDTNIKQLDLLTL